MSETYCGKSCESCPYAEKLKCPGCKAGPGRPYSGDCEIAICCYKEKGHENCETCGFNGNCSTLHSRNDIPRYRLQNQTAEVDRKAKMAQRTAFLGKWLWLLFWLVIPSSLAGVMVNEDIVGMFPALYLPGQILNTICSLAYGLILLKLSSEEGYYGTSGKCCLAAAAINVVVVCVTAGGSLGDSEGNLALFLTLPAAIISLVGEYYEYTAHGVILSGVDDKQSEKWHKLWKWYIGVFGCIFGSAIAVIILPVFGLLILLVLMAALIGLVVVSILKLVYLYRTARRFREYLSHDTNG